MPADIFDTASVRSRVLASWAASPARFREDANAEEELIRGAYRDRLVVELAQNAADAAVRARVPGRLLLRCDEGTLVAANVGRGWTRPASRRCRRCGRRSATTTRPERWADSGWASPPCSRSRTHPR